MIFGKTQKIMKNGISKYSKQWETTTNNTQILLKSNDSGGIKYIMCNCWEIKKEVSFKELMDVKVDLLGIEIIATPFLRKSMDLYAKKYNTSINEINLFIFEKNDKIGIAVYENINFKEVLSLEKHFEQLGI